MQIRRQPPEGVSAGRTLTAVQLNGVPERAGPPVMEVESLTSLEVLLNPDAPKRRCPPLARQGGSLRISVIQVGPHVVKEQVCVGMEDHFAQNRDVREARREGRQVTAGTADVREELLAGAAHVGVVSRPRRAGTRRVFR